MSNIVILTFNGTYSSSIYGIIETCLTLDKYNNVPINIITVSEDGFDTIGSQGEPISVDTSIALVKNCETIIIPAIEESALNTILSTPISPRIKNWLQYHHRNGRLICSHYNSIFILGEAELLGKKRATCEPVFKQTIKKRYPSTNLMQGPALLVDENILTTSTLMSWASIAYFILYRRMGEEVDKHIDNAINITKVDVASDIAPYVDKSQSTILTDDQFITQAEQAIRNSRNLKTVNLADSLNISTRTLHRRIKDITHETPKEFIDRVKVDHACELLSGSNNQIKKIAATAGFYSDAIFRKVFFKHTGMSPTQYRNQKTPKARKKVYAIQPENIEPNLFF